MTLLQICAQIATTSGFAQPESIIGNDEEIAASLLAIAHEAGKSLLLGNVYDDKGTLLSTHNWLACVYTESFFLPSTNGIILYDQIIAQDKIARIVSVSYNGKPVDFTIISNGLTITKPDVKAYYTLKYISANWVIASDQTRKAIFTDDADITVFNMDLFKKAMLWRFLKKIGKSYLEEKLEYFNELKVYVKQERNRKSLVLL